ncbi:MAG: hypothetical protein ACTHK7_06550 [Aureliella sp.]
MSHLLSGESPARSPGPSEPSTQKRVAQIGLSTLLLATACIAAWGSTWLRNRQIRQLEQRVAELKSLTRELVIKDRNRISVIQQQPRAYAQRTWHLYVPNDSLGLHLITRGVPSRWRPVTSKHRRSVRFAPLTSGRHVVELKTEPEDGHWLTRVFVDDQPVIAVREPPGWKGQIYDEGSFFHKQADLPADKPVALYDCSFLTPTSPLQAKAPEPTNNGKALWIDKLPVP